jgi:alpha-galactosidase
LSQTAPITLNIDPRLRLRAAGGLLNVIGPGGQPLLRDLVAGIETSDGVRHTTRGDSSEVRATDDGATVRSPGTTLRPELRWHIVAAGEKQVLRLWVEVENTTPRPLAIERIDVLVAPSGYYQTPASEVDVAQTGWQSWSRATPPVPLNDAYSGPPPIVAPILPPTEAERTVVPWMTLLRVPGGHGLLAGFTSARDQTGVIAIQPTLEGHRFTASTYTEGVALVSGATVRSETLLLIFNQATEAALERYARELSATMDARPWPHPITGWASWYYFFTQLGEDDVLSNLRALARERPRMPIEYVRVDDSYQVCVGDWLTLNDKYPRGMRFLSDAIHAHGYKAGIWLAPFLLSERSEVYADHPDWVVRDHNDQPIDAIYNWGTRNYALDTTHPEAMEWLRSVVATMLDEWGYEYLMIDFVYAAALRGKRHDNGCTSIQAYRRGLNMIREVAGDRYVLGCGAPFAPSVGLVNGMRIDPDIERFWRNEHRERNGSEPALLNAIRSTLAHGWMHNRLWVNDPDPLIVREGNSDLTLPEVQSWASIVALSGGVVQLSDDMSSLESQRAAIIPRLLPPLGEAGAALGPCVDGVATRIQLTVDRSWERWLGAAMFNWEDEPRSLTFNPADWDRNHDGEYHLFDLWSGEHFGPVSGSVRLDPTAAHGVRLLSVHTHLRRPQLVGCTLHLLGGAVELVGEDWSDDALTLTLRCAGEHLGELAVYVPEGYKPKVSGELIGDSEFQDHLLTVPLRLVDHTLVSLRFERSGELKQG